MGDRLGIPGVAAVPPFISHSLSITPSPINPITLFPSIYLHSTNYTISFVFINSIQFTPFNSTQFNSVQFNSIQFELNPIQSNWIHSTSPTGQKYNRLDKTNIILAPPTPISHCTPDRHIPTHRFTRRGRTCCTTSTDCVRSGWIWSIDDAQSTCSTAGHSN